MPAVNDNGQVSSQSGDLGYIAKCGLIISIEHMISGEKAQFVGSLTDLKDSYTSDWNAEPVYGRMDPISTFKSTTRQISLNWTILNESVSVGNQNMKQLSKLINFLYPSYTTSPGSNAGTVSAAPLLKLKFTNLISDQSSGAQAGLLGYAGGFVFDPDVNAGWISAKSSNMIAQQINAGLSFTVLHTNKLGWSNGKLRSPLFPYGKRIQDKTSEDASSGKPVIPAVVGATGMDGSTMEIDAAIPQPSEGVAVSDAVKKAQEGRSVEPNDEEKDLQMSIPGDD